MHNMTIWVLFIYVEIIIALKGFLKFLANGEGEVEALTGGKYFEMFTTHYFQTLMVFFFVHTHRCEKNIRQRR